MFELVAVVVVVSILTGMAAPHLRAALDRARVARASADIRAIEVDVADYQVAYDSLPSSLAAIGRAAMMDPWGNPYRYSPCRGAGSQDGARVDRAQRPLNSDYDLYSTGADGATSPPLTAANSYDDVVRADDGGFVGPARAYR